MKPIEHRAKAIQWWRELPKKENDKLTIAHVGQLRGLTEREIEEIFLQVKMREAADRITLNQ